MRRGSRTLGNGLRMGGRLLRRWWAVALCLCACAQATWAGDGTLLAVYADAVGRDETPPGWRFECNARGALGDESGYAPLDRIPTPPGQRTRVQYGVTDEQGKQRRDRPYQWAYGHVGGVRDAERMKR